MKSKKIDPDKHYKWLIWPQMYFLIVQKLCDYLIKKIDDEEYLQIEEKEMDYYERLEYPNMIVPIIYNLKHGIELYLKGVGAILDQEYNQIHDIDLILKVFNKKIKDALLEKDLKVEFGKIINSELKPIIKKYYYGKYISNIDYKLDKMNFSERYPQNDGYKIPDSILVDYLKQKEDSNEKIFYINKNDILEIKKDTEKIHRIIRKKLYIPIDKELYTKK